VKKFLVIGDSFAQVDLKSLNWALLWAKKHNARTEHYSIPGGSHVAIVNEFFSKNQSLSDVSGVFYFSTDLLRAEGVEAFDSFDNIRVMDKINENVSELWHHVLSGNATDFQWPMSHRIMAHQYGRTEYTTNFYNTIDIKWLIRANYNSIIMLTLYCKINNVPMVIVDNFNQLYIPEISKQLNVSIWKPEVRFSENTDSINHISLLLAEKISEEFDNSHEKEIMIPSELSAEEKTKEMIERFRKRDPFIYR